MTSPQSFTACGTRFSTNPSRTTGWSFWRCWTKPVTSLQTRINAVTALVLALVNALAAFVGLPHWATAEGVGLANSAALSVAALIQYIVTKRQVVSDKPPA